ncbi:MAG TPA: hypothetical protein VJ890_15000 [Vineibacter sp.]|nr:hypothetical protein [Vineibacter sp.]
MLATGLVCAVVLGWVLPQVAQPCVLYGSAALPCDALRLLLPALDLTPPSVDAARRCLASTDARRELAVTLIDNVFAVTYGAGLALLLQSWARREAGATAVARLLRIAAACFIVAAIFDLAENQITAILLAPLGPTVSDVLIVTARICAMPKYVLALVLGPALALLAGTIALTRSLKKRNGRT